MEINKDLEKIIFLLENDKFEDLWREYKNDEISRQESFILKAFVNASVTFELYKMQRIEHSNNVWNTYKKYENLIDKLETLNTNNYKRIKEIIYKKREEYIK